MHLIRPRYHAAYIADLPTKKARADALASVPIEYQAMVKTHVTNLFMLRAADKKRARSFLSRRSY
jgi:hypothetical protein